MGFAEWVDSRTSNLTVVDVALIKWSCITGGVLVAKLVPSLQRVDTRVLVAIALALAAKPALSALTTPPPSH